MTEQATEPRLDTETSDSGQPQAEPVRGGWLAFAAVAYLVVMLAVLRRFIEPASGDTALASAAGSLMQLTLAGILAGAAVGAWSSARFASTKGISRYLIAISAGVVTGALAGVAVLLVRGMPNGAVWTLAAVLGLSGAVGGALSTIRPAAIVRAGMTSTLTAVIFFNLLQLNSSPLLRFFGADGTGAGNESANGYLALTQALVAGIAGGLISFWLMRREGVTRWPLFALAGGLPGLVWIVGDVFTRLGTANLLTLASTDAAGDRMIQYGLGASRINTGLVLFFIGAVTAIVALGRTLPKPADR
jgi:hypothetical protein